MCAPSKYLFTLKRYCQFGVSPVNHSDSDNFVLFYALLPSLTSVFMFEKSVTAPPSVFMDLP